MRQIVLDTETTGLEPADGHRVIEIGCYELCYRRASGRTFHHYLNPDREVEPGAIEVHGITNEFLADKPRFCDIATDFIEFIRDAELIIHNAPFDVGFLDYEFSRLTGSWGRLADYCQVTDTLALARERHPGQRNSLDALCTRYAVDNAQRSLHGALLDAQLLAEVYLLMTGGQTALSLESGAGLSADLALVGGVRRLDPARPRLPVVRASSAEQAEHRHWLDELDQAVGGCCVWRQLEHEAGEEA
ncbi:DNA polymerase III subunit epsilon [Nitrococcus mobilis]|uniref:DNA polymerase III subunit epsilon n=1 Tax=Nitrococcus mobilis Nb-231 TaxID=314278 RepID=A4BUT2_9GAMM|nr:DNA polymerase III subunit epsilon [Nitrococcus mobilis]EAR20536.1 DNA polymerase III, epsilon subunit [Nitrococcus mobilis Nb-231]